MHPNQIYTINLDKCYTMNLCLELRMRDKTVSAFSVNEEMWPSQCLVEEVTLITIFFRGVHKE